MSAPPRFPADTSCGGGEPRYAWGAGSARVSSATGEVENEAGGGWGLPPERLRQVERAGEDAWSLYNEHRGGVSSATGDVESEAKGLRDWAVGLERQDHLRGAKRLAQRIASSQEGQWSTICDNTAPLADRVSELQRGLREAYLRYGESVNRNSGGAFRERVDSIFAGKGMDWTRQSRSIEKALENYARPNSDALFVGALYVIRQHTEKVEEGLRGLRRPVAIHLAVKELLCIRYKETEAFFSRNAGPHKSTAENRRWMKVLCDRYITTQLAHFLADHQNAQLFFQKIEGLPLN